MNILLLDFESTGIDPKTARPTEFGWVLVETNGWKPLVMEQQYLHEDGYPEITKENFAVTGISLKDIVSFGMGPRTYLSMVQQFCLLHSVQYLVAHNAYGYDEPLMRAEANRVPIGHLDALLGLPWIDTRVDLPHKFEPESHKLKHLATDYGFINPFPHRALTDCLTMLKICSNFTFEEILEYRSIPWVVIRADVSYNDRQLAKDARFSWEKLGEKNYPKCWVKKIKINKLEELRKAYTFPIVEIKESV